MNDILIQMPLHPTAEMLREVRENPLTSCDDKDEMNKRIGWLLCAYEVMAGHRCGVPVGGIWPEAK